MATVVTHKTRVLNVSLPPEIYDAVEEIAQAENRTKSELVVEAIRHYQFVRRWRVIRQWDAETAERIGIKNDEELERFLG